MARRPALSVPLPVRDLSMPVALAVPRASGTIGDDLIAWGLARWFSALVEDDVLLSGAGERYRITQVNPEPVTWGEIDELLAGFQPGADLSLAWLSSPTKPAPASQQLRIMDRDALRDAFGMLRQAGHAATPQAGDTPAITVNEAGARRYPLYQVLTNPGKQWDGYNALALATLPLATAAGIRLVLDAYADPDPLTTEATVGRLRELGLRKSDIWRNPPGFLFPGLNKGPTMRLSLEGGVTIVGDDKPDWLMTNRGDVHALALMLCYFGYFAVAKVICYDGGRLVLAPVPYSIRVPRGIQAVERVRPRASIIEDFSFGDAGLAYAEGALAYLREIAGASPARPVLEGVAVAQYWMPSGNTYAPKRVGLAPLPRWLLPLATEGYEAAEVVVRRHREQVRRMRGRYADERKISEERRVAITAYAASLSGDIASWFEAVARWFPAKRAESTIALWNEQEVIMIARTLEPDLVPVLEDGAFRRLAHAIRSGTVYAHRAREAARKGGPAPAYDPEYDLVVSLLEAAGRGRGEFQREFFRFAARYNDATLRRNDDAPEFQKRAMIKEGDLLQLANWLEGARGPLIALALVATGSSTRGKPAGDATPAVGAEDVEETGDDGEDVADEEDA